MRLRAIPLIVALAILVAPLATEAQQPTHVYRIGCLAATAPAPERARNPEAFLVHCHVEIIG